MDDSIFHCGLRNEIQSNRISFDKEELFGWNLNLKEGMKLARKSGTYIHFQYVYFTCCVNKWKSSLSCLFHFLRMVLIIEKTINRLIVYILDSVAGNL